MIIIVAKEGMTAGAVNIAEKEGMTVEAEVTEEVRIKGEINLRVQKQQLRRKSGFQSAARALQTKITCYNRKDQNTGRPRKEGFAKWPREAVPLPSVHMVSKRWKGFGSLTVSWKLQGRR
jgi:hypothetical protein